MTKTTLRNLLNFSLVLGLALTPLARAENNTFTYQGKLVDDCCPANGFYQMRFKLCSTEAGAPVSGTPVVQHLIFVSNGLFTTNLSFGPGSQVFDGTARWLEIEVSPDAPTPSFVTLLPRTELSRTPEAVFAQKAASVMTNAVTAQSIAPSQAVKSVNGLKDDVTIRAGSSGNVTVNRSGQDIVIDATTGGGITLPYIASTSADNRGVFELSNTHANGAGLYANGVQYGVRGQNGVNGNMGDLGNGAAGVHGRSLNGTAVRGDSANGNAGVFMGKVGIGTTTPAYMLDVAGPVKAGEGGFSAPWGPILSVPGGPNTRLLTMGWDGINGDRVVLEVPGATPNDARFNFTATGRVGIGTTTPTVPLQVEAQQGSERIVSTDANNGSVLDLSNYTPQLIDGPPVLLGAINFSDRVNTPGQIAYSLKGTEAMTFRVGGSERMSLDQSGNLHVQGVVSQGSDRHRKENIQPVNPRQLLERLGAMPVFRWNYTNDSQVVHLGPMAQDFHAAFEVGLDDKSICSVDADGVALAAIQGLYQLLQEKDALIGEQQSQLARFSERLATLENALTGAVESK